jgi:hypothetical protein
MAKGQVPFPRMNEDFQEIEDLAAIVLVPKAAFAAWLKSVDPDMCVTATDVLAETITQPVLLIPQPESEEEINEFLEPRKVQLLERELSEWCEDESKWPSPRTPALFDEWIEVRFHGEVSVLGGDEE